MASRECRFWLHSVSQRFLSLLQRAFGSLKTLIFYLYFYDFGPCFRVPFYRFILGMWVVWLTTDFCVCFLCGFHGLSMDYLWSIYRVSMEYPWSINCEKGIGQYRIK